MELGVDVHNCMIVQLSTGILLCWCWGIYLGITIIGDGVSDVN
jgi:hypothetical protein